MIIRIIIILLCLVFFINGCNNLVSQFFGTHKLRSLTMETFVREGVGDADYIRIDGAYLDGAFVYQQPEEAGYPPVLIYPVLAASEAGSRAALLAWTADFFDPCVDSGDCIAKGKRSLKGVVQPLPREYLEGLAELEAMGYEWPEPPVMVKENEAPVAWYWNALMMLGAAAVAIGLEAIYNRKKA